jgi:hypothetical protein
MSSQTGEAHGKLRYFEMLTIMISRFLVVACGNPSRCMTASIEAMLCFQSLSKAEAARKLKQKNMLTRGALLPLHYLGRLIVEMFRWCSNAMTTDPL